MAVDQSGTRRRSYSSPKRRQQAAETRGGRAGHGALRHARLERHGHAGRREGGGVSVETVYATFGNKTDLLMAASMSRSWATRRPSPSGSVPSSGRLAGPVPPSGACRRPSRPRGPRAGTRGIGRVREGAASDPTLATRLADGERNRRADVTQAAELVAAREVTTSESDGVWAVTSTEVFDLLVDRAGRGEDAYEDWLADTISRLLPAEDHAP